MAIAQRDATFTLKLCQLLFWSDEHHGKRLYSHRVSLLLQVLSGETLGVRQFGYSLAGNMDLDRNAYPDLAVGSLSDSVFVFK